MAAVPCISLNCRSEHWILVYALRYCELSHLWLLKKQALDFKEDIERFNYMHLF